MFIYANINNPIMLDLIWNVDINRITFRIVGLFYLAVALFTTVDYGSLIPAWINNFIHNKAWSAIIYPFENMLSKHFEVWEWTSKFIQHFTGHVLHIHARIKVNLC